MIEDSAAFDFVDRAAERADSEAARWLVAAGESVEGVKKKCDELLEEATRKCEAMQRECEELRVTEREAATQVKQDVEAERPLSY
jgi:predicted ATP-grasp superfamily ATP-dependent carboligase